MQLISHHGVYIFIIEEHDSFFEQLKRERHKITALWLGEDRDRRGGGAPNCNIYWLEIFCHHVCPSGKCKPNYRNICFELELLIQIVIRIQTQTVSAGLFRELSTGCTNIIVVHQKQWHLYILVDGCIESHQMDYIPCNLQLDPMIITTDLRSCNMDGGPNCTSLLFWSPLLNDCGH